MGVTLSPTVWFPVVSKDPDRKVWPEQATVDRGTDQLCSQGILLQSSKGWGSRIKAPMWLLSVLQTVEDIPGLTS